MKKYLALILLLSGCASKQEPFKVEDYSNFCPSEARLSEGLSKERIVYLSEMKDFYILPGNYILSKAELLRMPQASKNTSGSGKVNISSLEDFTNYLNDQVDGIKKIGSNVSKGIFPTQMTNVFPDRELAKELVVEKYIDTKNPKIVFCGLTLKSEYSPTEIKNIKYIAKNRIDENKNDDIYSGDGGRNYFTLTHYYK